MHKLSVVIITFNEEKNIRRCLESIKDIADEIVVVDSFSTDKTESICKEFNAKFITHKFDGYIEQKNYALSQAINDYILSLDADEAPNDILVQSIITEKKNFIASVYSVNRLTNYCGQWIRHGSWYPDTKIRLIKKNSGSWAGENPHDRFIPHGNIKVKHLEGDILHYSYYTLEEHILQINRFSTINAQSAFKNGTRSNWFKIIFNPAFRFVRDYFFKSGWRDGFYGYIICRNSAYSTFLKYIKLKKLQSEKQR